MSVCGAAAALFCVRVAHTKKEMPGLLFANLMFAKSEPGIESGVIAGLAAAARASVC